MADDTRNFIEHSQARAVLIGGRELSPSEMATEFAKLSPSERVDHLDRLNVEGETDLSAREAAKMLDFSRALRSTHETLRKVGR